MCWRGQRQRVSCWVGCWWVGQPFCIYPLQSPCWGGREAAWAPRVRAAPALALAPAHVAVLRVRKYQERVCTTQ